MSTRAVYDIIAKKLRESPLLIPLGLSFIVLFFASLALSYADYTASKLGYDALSVQKVQGWVGFFVALLPQLGQIITGFVFLALKDTRQARGYVGWAAIIGLLCFIVDAYTDIKYWLGPAPLPQTFVEALLLLAVFTLGSEVAFALSFGVLVRVFPDFIEACIDLGSKIVSKISNSPLFNGGDEEPPVGRPHESRPLNR